MGERRHSRGAANVADCEAQTERAESGVPLPGMTLAESIAYLTSLALAGGWRTDGERERAWGVFLRLAALGWRHGEGARTPRRAPGSQRTASTKR